MQSKKTTDLQGVDISSLQSISNETLLFSKIQFLYVRAYGSNHTGTGDTSAAGYITTAHTHKCPVGAYYFGTPFVDATAGFSTDAQLISQAQTQAQQFIDKLHTIFGAGSTGDLTPFLDLEGYYDNYDNQGHVHTGAYYPMASGMTSAQYVTWVKAFRDYFWTNTGRRLGFYMNYYFLTTNDVDNNGVKQGMGLTDAQIKDMNYNNEAPLWLAQYDSYYTEPALTTPTNFGGWTVWNAWQYSGTASASDYGVYHSLNQIDLDRCSDISYLQVPPVIDNWGLTDNQDGTLTITMTHPTTLDYIGTSLYQDGAWKKWFSKTTTSITLTLTQGQTYTFKLASEDTNHDMTMTAEKTITMYAPPPPVAPSDPTATTGTGTTGTTQTTQPVSIDPTTEVYGTIDITQYPQLKQARSFTVNGMDSRYFGFLVNKITRPFFPPLNVPSIAVPNKPGAIALNRNEWGVRTISIEVTLLGDSWNDLRQKVRNLAGFLIYQTDVPLIFSDEPALQYFARFNTTSTNLDEIAQTGQGTLVFTCFDPLAYSVTEETHLLDTNGFSYLVHNGGTAPCYPRFTITPTANCSFIKITNTTTNKSITFNSTWLAGDTLVLDCKNNTVYRDQDKESFIASITLDSEFFPLVAGDNNVVVSNQDPAGAGLSSVARVTWTECYY